MQKELNYTCDLGTVNVAFGPIEASKADDFESSAMALLAR